MNGVWRVRQDCNRGKFEVELTLKHTSATEFSGTSFGVTTGQSAQVTGGRIDGKTITFMRQAGPVSDRWTVQLLSAGRFSGTSSGPAWQCTYTATRK
mgnify:FL=1